MTNDSHPVQQFLGKLNSVCRSGANWKALCPAHSDSRHSLTISEGEDGKVLVFCHAGCTTESVVDSVGLSMSDLFAAEQRGRVTVCGDQNETVYSYRDITGNLQFEVVRLGTSQGKKKFFQRRFLEGRTVWGLKAGRYKLSGDGSYRILSPNEASEGSVEFPAVEKVLYRLPEIQTAIRDQAWILLCEGEKDADNGAKLGFATTTNPGGAGKWQPSYSQALQMARVAIVPDNDEPGRKGGAQIAGILREQGNEVRIVELGGTAKGYDLSDWIADQAKSHVSEEEIKKRLLAMIENAPVDAAETMSSGMDPDGEDGYLEGVSSQESETANAYRLRHHYRERLRWVSGIGYLFFDGQRWLESEVRAQELAMNLGRMISAEAKDLISEAAREKDLSRSGVLREQAERRLKWARQSEQAQTIRNSLRLATPLLELGAEELDRQKYSLNVSNGTIDMRTGELHSHRHEDYLTKLAPVAFEPNARAPRWEKFIEEIMCGNKLLIDFLQKALGYSTSGLISEQCLFLCCGEGNNGKTTLLNIIRMTLGKGIVAKAAPNLLMEDKYSSAHPTEIADLRGSRIAIVQEAPGGKVFDTAKLKELTGEIFIKSRKMHQDFFEFEITFKIWITANDLPVANENTEAFWRRIRLIPFRFSAATAIHNLDLDLSREEGPGIINWLIEGFKRYVSEGLIPPPLVAEATLAFREESDVIGRFIDSCCELGEGFMAQSEPLYQAYKAFVSKEVGGLLCTRPVFKATLEKRGFRQERKSQGNFYFGLGLVKDETRLQV